MSTLCKELKNYCIERMNDKQVINYIPVHYVLPVQARFKEKGLEIPSDKKIRNVRHKKQFDKQIVDVFVELAEENKEALQLPQNV